eukprot:TRINITY_DN106863_c0_g1_i1.p1 TRINITY_DN106863_c0_g1~~TRINITY_DN106863_c0_g1_i1.p1  ORF type:complete len:205 (-),score=37.50 TRINITY_DN106863_c0_g1_i1:179-793(-)
MRCPSTICDGYIEGSHFSEAPKKPAWSLVVCKTPFKSGSLATRTSNEAKRPHEVEPSSSFPVVNNRGVATSHRQTQRMLRAGAEEVPEELEVDKAAVLASVSQVDPSASNGRRFWTFQAGPVPNLPDAEDKEKRIRQQLASSEDPCLDEEVPEELAAAGACEPGLLSHSPRHISEVPDEVESDYESSGSIAAEDEVSANLDDQF